MEMTDEEARRAGIMLTAFNEVLTVVGREMRGLMSPEVAMQEIRDIVLNIK